MSRLLTKPHFALGAPGSAARQGFLAVRLKTVPQLGFSVDPVFFMDDQLCLVKRTPETCSQSITFRLKPAPLLGFERIQTLSRALKAAGCSQTITMRYNPRHCWVFLLL